MLNWNTVDNETYTASEGNYILRLYYEEENCPICKKPEVKWSCSFTLHTIKNQRSYYDILCDIPIPQYLQNDYHEVDGGDLKTIMVEIQKHIETWVDHMKEAFKC